MNSVPIENCWIESAISQNLSNQLQGWWGRLAFHPMPCLMRHASKPFTIGKGVHVSFISYSSVSLIRTKHKIFLLYLDLLNSNDSD